MKTKRFRPLFFAAGLLLAGFPGDVSVAEPPPSLEAIRQCHLQAVEGNKEAVGKTLALLEPLCKQYPDNPLYLVYKGSCLALQARDAYWPPKKLELARAGFSKMDEAVAKEPGNPEVRFIRAMCGINVPFFFHRLDQALRDFDFIVDKLNRLQKKNEDGAMVYFYAAKGYLKNSEKEKAAFLLKRAIKMDNGTRWKMESQKLLSRL